MGELWICDFYSLEFYQSQGVDNVLMDSKLKMGDQLKNFRTI